MKALEFETTLDADGNLKVPEELAAQFPTTESVRVVILFPDSEDGDWRGISARQFLDGYADSDSIYDAL